MKRAMLLALALALVAASVALAGKPIPPPPPPPGPSDIAFGSATNYPGSSSTGDLTLVQDDGSGKQVLYVASREVKTPDWSHDGKYIAFYEQPLAMRVVQTSTGKSCVLMQPYEDLFAVRAPKFHPGFDESVGDGRYVIAYDSWAPDYGGQQLLVVSFTFTEGTCQVIQEEGSTVPPDAPGRILTSTAYPVGYDGAVWSPTGNQLASRMFVDDADAPFASWLRIHDVIADSTGRLVLSGTYVDYPLGDRVNFSSGFKTLQWSPNGNRLALIGKWVNPEDGNGSKEIFEIDISTNPPGMTQITDTAVDETYFDYLPDGAGMVVGRTDGIFLVPGTGNPVAGPETARKKVMKWPHSPAWNPTRW